MSFFRSGTLKISPGVLEECFDAGLLKNVVPPLFASEN